MTCKTCTTDITDQNSVPKRRVCRKCANRESAIRNQKYRNTFGTFAFYYRKLSRIRNSARKRGIECSLTLEDVKDILSKRICFYCGKEPEISSFDRKDNSIGYQTGNVALCCLNCNNTKRDLLTKEEAYKAIESLEKRILGLKKILPTLK